MPLYLYKCQKCELVQEHLLMSVDDSPDECDNENCDGKTDNLEKLMTSASFHLKGGGWYKDGYSSGPSEPDRGSKEAKIRSEIKERHQDRVKQHDEKAKSLGMKRVGDFQEVKMYPDKIIE